MLHGRGTGSPSSVARRTHPGRHTRVTRKGPSQLGESLFIPSRLRIHLELPATHEPLMIALERLLVACIFNSRLPPSLIN
jgi:hypothetical protein